MRRRTDLPFRLREQLLGVVDEPRLEHELHVPRVPDVGQRVAAHDEQIGELADLDRSELVRNAQRPRTVDRGDLERRAGGIPISTSVCSSRCAEKPARNSPVLGLSVPSVSSPPASYNAFVVRRIAQ